MRSVLVRYQAKPERVAENRGLIEAVFAELSEVQPEKLRYVVLESEDGTFFHYGIVPTEADDNPLRKIGAFQRFQANNADRQLVKAVSTTPRVIGNYRMLLGEPDAYRGK